VILALTATGDVVAWNGGVLTNVPPTATNMFAVAVGIDHCLAIKGEGMPPTLLGPMAFGSAVQFGDLLPLSARAVGAQPLEYEWLGDGLLIPNLASAFAEIPAATAASGVTYQVVVSNQFGSVTSSVAQITVRPLNIWGSTTENQHAFPDSATNCFAVAAGGFHCLSISPDGSVVGWGKNLDSEAKVPAEATNAVAVAGGGDHSLALKPDGTVVAWGRDWDGQTDVPPDATNVIAIAAGWAHSLALRADGTVSAWGNDDFGQTDVSFLANRVVAIAAGRYHSMALRSDGTVATWGLNSEVPPEVTNVVTVAAGYENCLALRADGTVVAWGDNSYGQSSVPPEASNVVAIAAGYYHAIALRADGTVVVWGKGSFGVTQIPPERSMLEVSRRERIST
jgi:alpha-tubulin suppressor-like RCC1 family protein